jgi:hypothetical protein
MIATQSRRISRSAWAMGPMGVKTESRRHAPTARRAGKAPLANNRRHRTVPGQRAAVSAATPPAAPARRRIVQVHDSDHGRPIVGNLFAPGAFNKVIVQISLASSSVFRARRVEFRTEPRIDPV